MRGAIPLFPTILYNAVFNSIIAQLQILIPTLSSISTLQYSDYKALTDIIGKR